MRYLALIWLLDCAPGAIDKPTPTETAEPADTADGGPLSTPDLTATFTVAISVPTRDQIYDMEPAPTAGDGCFLVGDPYAAGVEMGRYTGAVSLVCPSDGNAVEVPGDTLSWYGSGEYQALGCDIEVSTLPDGTVVVGSSEFADPTYVGRALLWPLDADPGLAQNVAILDMYGEAEGDANTGGYLGTAALVHAGVVYVSQTNTVPYLLAAPWSDRLTTADLEPVLADGAPYCGLNCGGFMGDDASSGEDGTAWYSFGAVLQHVDADGSPDWWSNLDGVGMGEYSWPTETDATIWGATTRLHDGSVVMSVLSREARAAGEVTYAQILDASTGSVLDDLPNVYGVVSGEVDGTTWTAYGVEDCDPSASGCDVGYVHISTSTGQEIDLSLPFEAGSFPATGCLVELASAGDGYLGWFCKDLTSGGIMRLTP